MKQLRFTSLGLALVALAVSSSVFANSWYEIELIAFSRTTDKSLKEQFEAPTQQLKTSNAMDLMRPLVQPAVADLIKAIPACAPTPAASDATAVSRQHPHASTQPSTVSDWYRIGRWCVI